MKIIVPDYYKDFKCIADKCRHSCCQGWEIEIDEESLKRFEQHPDIACKIMKNDDSHDSEQSACFGLVDNEKCPFLLGSGLCDMILRYGEDMLCQTCTDHPRYRNYWADRIEMGLGLVCEEAARLVLSLEEPMRLVILDGGENEDADDISELPEDEQWLYEIRDKLLRDVSDSGENGPIARYREYLIYRHIPDALYDDRLSERIAFVNMLADKAKQQWLDSDNSIEALAEIVRVLSYDIEYDEEVKERILDSFPHG